MTAGAGWPMGPCTLVDLVGIDVHVHASEALYEKLREPRMAPPAAHRGDEERRSARPQEPARGFYRYDRPDTATHGFTAQEQRTLANSLLTRISPRVTRGVSILGRSHAEARRLPLLVLALARGRGLGCLGGGADAGTLSVERGKGVVMIDLRGSVLGRLTAGSLRVTDQTPNDRYGALVVGRKLTQERLGPRTVLYRGQGLASGWSAAGIGSSPAEPASPSRPWDAACVMLDGEPTLPGRRRRRLLARRRRLQHRARELRAAADRAGAVRARAAAEPSRSARVAP